MAERFQEPEKIDIRMYIAVVLLRWKMLAAIFLWSLLLGVFYIQLAPKKYKTFCSLMIYRDPNLTIASSGTPMSSFSTHAFLIQSDEMCKRVVNQLMKEWGGKVGAPRVLALRPVARQSRQLGSTLEISVETSYPKYAEDFLNVLLDEHEKEWGSIQKAALENVTAMLSGELEKLEDKIRIAEDDLIDYLRLHDIPRVDTKSSLEARYLAALMERRSQITTEIMLMDAQYPALKNANAGVINQVVRVTRETGAMEPLSEDDPITADVSARKDQTRKPRLPDEITDKVLPVETADEMQGWHELRIKLAELRRKEKELVLNLKPEHPQYKALLTEISDIEKKLDTAAQIELGRLRDRREALTIQMNALESAEYKWKSDSLLAGTRRAELKRISDVVARFESNYRVLYQRFHDLRISEEMKAEYFRQVSPVATLGTPVWPDPMKILLVALSIGLGGGFGLVLLAQMFDNKIQTIRDVEETIGVPFLGGVPYWVRGGLEHAVRPIVTEEHSTGAVESYRALRTSILNVLTKMGEKMVFVTSADSREGKTLTTLNMAILIAQMGKKVLLIDMDLRRGRLHRSLGVDRNRGATDVISSGDSLTSVVHKTRYDNLYFISCGETIENTAELLQATDIPGLFLDVQKEYDYIFIDTPPVLRVTDTVILTGQGVGVVLYVAKVNHTPKPMIKYSIDMLSDAKIIGLIMNNIEMHRISSLYYAYQYPNYAYYSNAYAYGYDYYYYGDRPAGRKMRRRERSLWEKRRFAIAEWLRRTFIPMD